MMRRDILMASGLLAAAPFSASAGDARPATAKTAEVRTRDGQTLFVKDWGQGRPIVFVAGLGLPSDMWDNQATPLALRGFRCITFDRRGHGRSSVPDTGYDIDTLADDLAAVLEAHDVRDAVLVGLSVGCAEIVRYMTRHGGRRVSRLVLVATAGTPYATTTGDYDEGPTPEQRQYFLDQVILGDYHTWMMDNQAAFFLPDTPAMTQTWVVQMMLRTPLMAIYQSTRIAGTIDFRAELPTIKAPTLLIHGDRDASSPVLRSQRTAQLMPDARLVVYEGAPHGMFVTHAARLTADIAAFAG